MISRIATNASNPSTRFFSSVNFPLFPSTVFFFYFFIFFCNKLYSLTNEGRTVTEVKVENV